MRHLGTKTIETDRLILRRFQLEDAKAMYNNWANDPEVTKFLTWPVHQSIEVTKKVLESWVSEYEKPDQYQWCIELKQKAEAIGSISVVKYQEKVFSMEIGYCIGRDYWRQGITSEALAAVISYLTKEVGARRIEARHDVRNPNSGRVMRKCGLKYEGTTRKADWNNSGICDCDLYGLVVLEEEESPVFSGQERESEAPQLIKAEKTAVRTAPQNQISDETIEYVGILAQLELSEEEKEHAKKDIGEMLDYIDKLNELNTAGVEPMSHVFPVNNVFREDIVTNGDGSSDTLDNAPQKKDGGFMVPKTIG